MRVISKNLVKKVSGGNQEKLSVDCRNATIDFFATHLSDDIGSRSSTFVHLFDQCTAEELIIIGSRIDILKNIKESMGNGRQ